MIGLHWFSPSSILSKMARSLPAPMMGPKLAQLHRVDGSCGLLSTSCKGARVSLPISRNRKAPGEVFQVIVGFDCHLVLLEKAPKTFPLSL